MADIEIIMASPFLLFKVVLWDSRTRMMEVVGRHIGGKRRISMGEGGILME